MYAIIFNNFENCIRCFDNLEMLPTCLNMYLMPKCIDDDVKVLTSSQIAQICGTDSGTATKIFEVMAGSSKAAQRAAARIDKTLLRRKALRRKDRW